MQKLFLFLCGSILLSNTVISQGPGAAEIKKLKIKKMIVYYGEKGKEGTSIASAYFDANGNDTADYTSGKRISYKVIEYDAMQRPKTIMAFSDKNEQKDKTIFTYKTDGSFVAINTDTQFGLKNTDIFDKKGLQLTHTVPDGSVHKYVYNAKGQLSKVFSVPRNDGVKFTREYTYNAAGKLISSINKGDFPFSSTYEYDTKGLLKKVKSTSVNESSKKEISVQNYEYGY